jgi:hypothetical protein
LHARAAQQSPDHASHPAATRPWQHVLDPLYGYLLLRRAYREPMAYRGRNFGPHPECRGRSDLADAVVSDGKGYGARRCARRR